MAIGVLVLGESGTGKTYSIKNFKPDEVTILSVRKPILPFRGKYEVIKTPTAEEVQDELKKTKKKFIVVDDFQYILGVPMMQRIGEKGWEKFSEIQQGYSDILDTINELPDDTIVFLNSHIMYNDDTGRTQIKTIGKALDKYITIEGLFMIVLGTQVVDGKYYFITQNSGSNTLKSPEGMFPSLAIPNDLRYVADKILNYYYMDGAKSDEEIATDDAAAKTDVTPDDLTKAKRKSRRSKSKDKDEKPEGKAEAEQTSEPAESTEVEEPAAEPEEPKRKSRRAAREKKTEEARNEYLKELDEKLAKAEGDEVPFEKAEPDKKLEAEESAAPTRRRRRRL